MRAYPPPRSSRARTTNATAPAATTAAAPPPTPSPIASQDGEGDTPGEDAGQVMFVVTLPLVEQPSGMSKKAVHVDGAHPESVHWCTNSPLLLHENVDDDFIHGTATHTPSGYVLMPPGEPLTGHCESVYSETSAAEDAGREYEPVSHDVRMLMPEPLRTAQPQPGYAKYGQLNAGSPVQLGDWNLQRRKTWGELRLVRRHCHEYIYKLTVRYMKRVKPSLPLFFFF